MLNDSDIRQFILEQISESLDSAPTDLLLEIDFSPDNLRRAAAAIDARAGMEFEMIMPHSGGAQYFTQAISQAIGRPVIPAYQHGGPRQAGAYTLEPDGSLGDSGLELVSPVLRINDLFDDFRKLKRWARQAGVRTDARCGLHMNVSVPIPPGKTLRQKVNYVKLALLVGDEEVLQQYGRLTNTYCQSAMRKIKERAHNRALCEEVLREIRADYLKKAGRILHPNQTEKYTSINLKEHYVEFRSPGGDYLSRPIEHIELTLLRFVVALDAACDTNKYRRLYRARLEALVMGRDPMSISNADVNSDTSRGRRSEVNIFVELFSGDATPAQLASLIVDGDYDLGDSDEIEPAEV